MKTVLPFILLVAAIGTVNANSIQRQTCPSIESIKRASTCLDIIRLLSKCDKCLDSRGDLKAEMAKKAKSAEEFVNMMKGRQCNGTEYNCGHTTSWVAEIFQGLKKQFEENKYDEGTGKDKSGIKSYKSADLKALFESKANSSNMIVYRMRHTGTHDHVWIIEQLAGGKGYRLYQSYHDGYSLRAWLSQDLTGLYDPDHGDIMLPRTVQKDTDTIIRNITHGKGSLKNLAPLKAHPKFGPLFPFAEYLANYDKNQTIELFKKAWNRFGKGKTLSREEFMSGFMSKLTDIVAYFETHGITNADPYPREVWNKWIELYAAWDPTYFPGLPNNGMISQIKSDGIVYRFQVQTVEIQGQPKCQENALFMLG